MEILYESTVGANVSVLCHLIGPERLDSLDINSFGNPIGFIVLGRYMAPLGKMLHEAGKRVVIVGAPHINQTFGAPCVCGNQEYGGYLVTKHLVELGHRNIAYADLNGFLVTHPRWQGHLKMMREAAKSGVALRQQIISPETLRQWIATPAKAAEFFRTPGAPTAMAAWNDRDALDLMATFSRAGLSVPNEVSVTGYDNLEEGRRNHPSLTTVDHLIDQQVAAALELVTAETAPEASRTMIFSPTLAPRESSGPVH
jgi:LacI family transcriptional regulator